MTRNQLPELVDVSSLTSIEQVANHLTLLEQAKKECLEDIAALMAEELERKGVTHATAIHDLKQRRTVVEFQITFLRSRLNRLKDEKALSGAVL